MIAAGLATFFLMAGSLYVRADERDAVDALQKLVLKFSGTIWTRTNP